MAKSNADRQREYKERRRGNGVTREGNEIVTPVTKSTAEGNGAGNETVTKRNAGSNEPPENVTLNMSALVEGWAGDNCQCGHCCNARRHEHKRRLNHGAWMSIEQLVESDYDGNRVSIPGDVDYVGTHKA